MRIHFWNVVFSLFFAVLVLFGSYWLIATRAIFYDVPFIDMFLMSLAIFRLVRLFTYDVITQFIRDWFVGAKVNSLPHTLGALINCPWCTGLWFSFLVVFFYFATAFAWPIIMILALAALGSFLQVLANLVGWMAEERKQTALAMKK